MSASLKAGFVTKQGHKVRNWLPRYMVLDQSLACLVYFKGQPPFHLREKGRVNLVGAAVVDCSVGAVRPHVFDVVTAAGTHYPIQARDAADRAEWVAAIRAVIVAASRRGEAADAAAFSAAVAAAAPPSVPIAAAREVHVDDAALHASLYIPPPAASLSSNSSLSSLGGAGAATTTATSASVPDDEFSSDDGGGLTMEGCRSPLSQQQQQPLSSLVWSSPILSEGSLSSGSSSLATAASAASAQPSSAVAGGGGESTGFERAVSFQEVVRAGSHNEYVILVRCHGESWTIQRRYRNFAELHGELRREFPPPILARHILPAKRMLGSNSPEFLAERKMLLEHYLRELFNDPIISQSGSFRRFLEYDEHACPVVFRRI